MYSMCYYFHKFALLGSSTNTPSGILCNNIFLFATLEAIFTNQLRCVRFLSPAQICETISPHHFCVISNANTPETRRNVTHSVRALLRQSLTFRALARPQEMCCVVSPLVDLWGEGEGKNKPPERQTGKNALVKHIRDVRAHLHNESSGCTCAQHKQHSADDTARVRGRGAAVCRKREWCKRCACACV